MGFTSKSCLYILIILIILCIVRQYIFIYESIRRLYERQNDTYLVMNNAKRSIMSDSLTSSHDSYSPSLPSSPSSNISLSHQLNQHLFKLSSIERTAIDPLDWTNPNCDTIHIHSRLLL